MTLKRLAAIACVLPIDSRYPSWTTCLILGPGSIVDVLGGRERSPLTGADDEIVVKAVDVIGREYIGLVAKTTTFSATSVKSGSTLTREGFEGDELSGWDTVRFAMSMARSRGIAKGDRSPWSPARWMSKFGSRYTTHLSAMIRAFGKAVPRGATPDEISLIALRLMTNDREATMSTDTEETSSSTPAPAAKRAAKKATKTATKAAKKTAKKTSDKPVKRKVVAHADGAPARSMSRTVGNTLLPLFEKAHAKRDLIALAKKLAGDEKLGKKQMTELRDGVNALATEMREAKKDSVASSLSSANRLVRRLARQA